MSSDGRRITGNDRVSGDAFLATLPAWWSYGVGVSAANDLVLAGAGSSAIGGTFVATTSGAQGARTLTLLSWSSASFPVFGGVGLVDPAQSIGGLLVETPIGGVSSNALTLPTLASLVGRAFFLQSASRDAAKPGGWGLSNGLKVVVEE